MSKLESIIQKARRSVEHERFRVRPVTHTEATQVAFVSRERRGQATYPHELIARACARVEAERMKVAPSRGTVIGRGV